MWQKLPVDNFIKIISLSVPHTPHVPITLSHHPFHKRVNTVPTYIIYENVFSGVELAFRVRPKRIVFTTATRSIPHHATVSIALLLYMVHLWSCFPAHQMRVCVFANIWAVYFICLVIITLHKVHADIQIHLHIFMSFAPVLLYLYTHKHDSLSFPFPGSKYL